MGTLASIGIIFIAISLIFLIATFRDYLKSKGEMTIARRIWLRLALIFAAIGIGLYFVQTFFR